jgi:hypothetical protein
LKTADWREENEIEGFLSLIRRRNTRFRRSVNKNNNNAKKVLKCIKNLTSKVVDFSN